MLNRDVRRVIGKPGTIVLSLLLQDTIYERFFLVKKDIFTDKQALCGETIRTLRVRAN